MHAMLGLWLLFSFILFVAEPLFLHRWFEVSVKREPAATFALVQRAHWLLLALSVITVAGAVAGSHGFLFFYPVSELASAGICRAENLRGRLARTTDWCSTTTRKKKDNKTNDIDVE